MSGRLNNQATGHAAHDVVRCSGVSDDGPCGREQAVASHDDGIGVRVVASVSEEISGRLSSLGWRSSGRHWLCPFCAGSLP